MHAQRVQCSRISDGALWLQAPLADRDAIRCRNLEHLSRWKNREVPLTSAEQRLWEALDCANRLEAAHIGQEPLRRSPGGKKCVELKEVFRVVPGKSWGQMEASEEHKQRWSHLGCDCYFDRKCKDRAFRARPPSIHSSTTAAGIAEAVKARPPSERLQPEGSRQVVAVVLGATSFQVRFETLEANPLFTKLLPSLGKTVLADYEYWIYVGFDTGDLFYDDAARLRSLLKWFRRNLAAPLRPRGVEAKMVFLNYTNLLRKPGPVFNFVAAAAVHDGADYIFRVNDDTEVETPGWAAKMAGELAGFRPANVGVVGPSGRHDASATRFMITHDFVHRTHLRIFETYYPPVLSDWWMDDWISHVYPGDKAKRLRGVVVVHHTEVVANTHGTAPGDPVRYDVDFSHKPFLRSETSKGAKAIAGFLRDNCDAADCPLNSQDSLRRGGDRRASGPSVGGAGNSYSGRTAEDEARVGADDVSLDEKRFFGATDAGDAAFAGMGHGRAGGEDASGGAAQPRTGNVSLPAPAASPAKAKLEPGAGEWSPAGGDVNRAGQENDAGEGGSFVYNAGAAAAAKAKAGDKPEAERVADWGRMR